MQDNQEYGFIHHHNTSRRTSYKSSLIANQILSTVQAAHLIKFLFILLCLVPAAKSQFLQGSIPTCDNEGETVKIPYVTDDPCISCRCQHGEVICNRQQCPSLDGCHMVVFPKPADQCCEQCLGCTYKGMNYTSGATWLAEKNKCVSLSCQSGVVTQSKVRCHTPCSHPIKAQGQCCPVCHGCTFNGINHNNGETFTAPDDPCATCTCTHGTVECKRAACPVLNCPLEFIENPSGSCCPYCRGSRKLFNLGVKNCLFRYELYNNFQTFRHDKCTDCVCNEGSLVCDRKVCPPLDCAIEDIIMDKMECCPRCSKSKKRCRSTDRWYKHGQHWQTNDCTVCSCTDGITQCHEQKCPIDVRCPKNFNLKYVNGECCPKCVEEDATCTAYEDLRGPNYSSFDGRIFDFKGSCQYTLAQVCDRKRNFTIRVRNEARETNDIVRTKVVSIQIATWKISLQQRFRVKVNGNEKRLPYEQTGRFTITEGRFTVTLKTVFGLKVIWDGDSYLEVSIPPMFKNKMCGLCGNYNGNKDDDLTGNNGVIYQNSHRFGETWRVGRKSGTCATQPQPLPSPWCKRSIKRQLRATELCSEFDNEAFATCRSEIDVQPYIRSCHLDVCNCIKGMECHCHALLAYQQACNNQGIEIAEWRLPGKCGAPKCPKGAKYKTCATACPQTCSNKSETAPCDRPCIPSCQCPEGTVLHEEKCINPLSCPAKTPKIQHGRFSLFFDY